MLANEHLIETHTSSAAGAWVRGNDFINKLLLYRSPHIDRLKHLLSTSTGFATADYNMAFSHWQLYCEQMEQAIQLDNEAIAQNNTAYWENLTDQVKLRDGFIRDQEYLMAYALYQFNYIETPIYATGQALIQQEITEEQLYSQLNAWTLADQLVYPIVDFVGLIPGVDIGADLVGFFYAQFRGDMQQAPLYAMALMLPPGLDNMAQYGGRGSCKMVAMYTANGITYVPKLADEPIDEAVEAVRASVLTHDPVIAQAIIDADAPYLFHEADQLYQSRHRAIYQGTGNDLAKAKLITGEIADHCPLLLANQQLVSRELSEVLAGIPEAAKRKAFLEALDGFGDIGKLTTFVEDLANAPELVVALKGRWELVRAWEVMVTQNVPDALRLNVPFLTKLSDNPNLVHFVDNLTVQGRMQLSQNVSEWIKLYDVRVRLKNDDIEGAVSVLEGTLESPRIYNGANYVDNLTSAQATKFNNIINLTTDVAQISSNLGISPNVVLVMKQHLFVNEHLVEVSPGIFVKGRFATFEYIADWWNAVKTGDLTNAGQLKSLIAHEYIEARLMQEGMLYRTLDSTPSASRYGAHELSSHEGNFDFLHWSAYGRNVPSFNLNSNLGNIDNVVNQIKTIEGL